MKMSHNPLLTTGEGQSRVLIPTITPLTPDGLLDEDSYCRYVRALFAAGVGGLYVNGSTGEGLHLEEPMRRRIAELAVELTQECNEADGDWRVCVIHVGAAQTSVALRLAEHAKSIGATCISSLPPFVGGTSFEEIVAYYERLAEFDVPILAYYIPMVTKIELTLAQLQSLAAVRNVIGFKFTSYNVELLMQLKARLRPEQQLYSGMDGVLVCGLMYGADGAIGAVYNIAPRQVVEVERRVRAGDLAGALEAQRIVNDVIERYKRAHANKHQISAIKHVLHWQGLLDCPRTVQRSELNEQQQVETRQLLLETCLGAGFIDK